MDRRHPKMAPARSVVFWYPVPNTTSRFHPVLTHMSKKYIYTARQSSYSSFQGSYYLFTPLHWTQPCLTLCTMRLPLLPSAFLLNIVTATATPALNPNAEPLQVRAPQEGENCGYCCPATSPPVIVGPKCCDSPNCDFCTAAGLVCYSSSKFLLESESDIVG